MRGGPLYRRASRGSVNDGSERPRIRRTKTSKPRRALQLPSCSPEDSINNLNLYWLALPCLPSVRLCPADPVKGVRFASMNCSA